MNTSSTRSLHAALGMPVARVAPVLWAGLAGSSRCGFGIAMNPGLIGRLPKQGHANAPFAVAP